MPCTCAAVNHPFRWARVSILSLLVMASLALSAQPGQAQSGAPADTSHAAGRVRLYLDCSEFTCDFEFLKQQLTWVDWVRDRQDADVYVLLTMRETGSGGLESQYFITRRAGEGPASDTVKVFTASDATPDDRRKATLRTLQGVLARDLLDRPLGERLEVRVAPLAAAETPAAPAKDPYDSWVFRLSGNGFINGQKSFRTLNTYVTSSASRVVEKSKLGASGYFTYNEQRFDELDFLGVQRSHGGTLRGVWSIGGHWSAGGRVYLNASKFSNLDLQIGAGPALEYDVFPYHESSRHQLSLAYEVTTRHNSYEEITLFGKTEETLTTQGLTAKLSLTQPWGSITLTPYWSQYLHDLSKYRLSTNANLELKLARGLSLNGSLYAARIRDQLGLRRGNATEGEVLLQQRQLATSYQYFGSVGISYSFGSRSNNVVNVRLDEVYGTF